MGREGVFPMSDSSDARGSLRAVDTMSGSDALLWTIGADPVMRPTIVAVMVFDGKPEWAEVRERLHEAHRRGPPPAFTCRDPSPGPRATSVRDRQELRMEMHLRHIRLPEHGIRRDVFDMAQTMATSGFDAALATLEAVLVEESDADRAFLVMKIHHALIDGVGALPCLRDSSTPSVQRHTPASMCWRPQRIRIPGRTTLPLADCRVLPVRFGSLAMRSTWWRIPSAQSAR